MALYLVKVARNGDNVLGSSEIEEKERKWAAVCLEPWPDGGLLVKNGGRHNEEELCSG